MLPESDRAPARRPGGYVPIALYVIWRVPAPERTWPPARYHVYVAPGPASGTESVYVAFRHCGVGSTNAALGASTATLADDVAGQPAAVTVTPRPTVPEAPAVNAICRVPAPDVIVPFVIVQT